ncbi:hypothetical protein C8Q79DRAFT_976495 [Trametes meyenii]|nr:hypothetical protein C8Q79DRAFT_976495 [Trametes meyenii]
MWPLLLNPYLLATLTSSLVALAGRKPNVTGCKITRFRLRHPSTSHYGLYTAGHSEVGAPEPHTPKRSCAFLWK